MSGWVFDPDTPTVQSTVHVYVDSQRRAVTADSSSPDVGAAYRAAGSRHGFTDTGQLTSGNHTVCANGIDTTYADRHTTLGCRTVTSG